MVPDPSLVSGQETELCSDALDWSVVRFDETITTGRVMVGKVEKSEYKLTGKYPIIDQSQQFIAGFSDEEVLVYRGDLPVVVFGDHTRVFKYIDFPFICGADGTKVLVPNEDTVDPQFLYFALSALDIPSKGYNRHYKLLRERSLSLPPLPEQRRIAHVLSTIQRAIQAQDAVIAATRQLKRSLMQRLFTYGPYAEPLPTKETEIGEVPEEWDIKRLGDIADIRTSTTSLDRVRSLLPPGETKRVPLLYLKVADMNLPGNSRHIVTSDTMIMCDAFTLSRLSSVPPGSVVFPKRGGAIGTNKKRITSVHCLLDPNMIAVIPGDSVRIGFLFAWLETFDLTTVSDKGPIPQLNKKDIEPVLTPLPGIQQQEIVVTQMEVVEEKIVSEIGLRTALEALFKSMLHQLMTGQVRVTTP